MLTLTSSVTDSPRPPPVRVEERRELRDGAEEVGDESAGEDELELLEGVPGETDERDAA